MNERARPKRREFLGAVAASAVALGVSGSFSRAFAQAPSDKSDIVPGDKWLGSVTGKHRQFFDMPSHENGMGLLPVRNYLNTLRDAYGITSPATTAVVSLYAMTTLLAFNDSMWQKYNIGATLKVMDGSNVAATSNVFYATPGGAKSLSITGAPLAIPADTSISALQKRGAVFILCNNAFNFWMGQLGGDKAPEVRKEFEANILPGVFLVPAMVVAIDQAQMKGCSYKYV